MRILTIIPARGGSKGIPRKNIRFMVDKPLIAYAIECAQNSSYQMDVAVSTEDEEIARVANLYGEGRAEVISRPNCLAGDDVTLDPVIYHALVTLEKKKDIRYDVVITMQPTSPLLKTSTLDKAIDIFLKSKCDTLISGENDPRLSWRLENGEYVPNYVERRNRQYLPKDIKETGAFVISKRENVTETSRIKGIINIFEVPENEACDIDTFQDWYIAELELTKKRLIIRTDGYEEIGMGHIYRGIQLAANLMKHEVLFVLSSKSDMGLQKISNSHFPFCVIESEDDFFDIINSFKPDIVINDILNTTVGYMNRLKKIQGLRVVNFEDMGKGQHLADAVINALYEGESGRENVYFGEKYYLIRDEFLLAKPKIFDTQVSEVIVLFGGTDPGNYTKKAVSALLEIVETYNIHVTVILGIGYRETEQIYKIVGNNHRFDIVRDVKLMTDYMKNADLAIASQGRTMYELSIMGVPTIIMAQNEREMMHEFGTMRNGFLNLGLGSSVEKRTLIRTISWLIECPEVRRNMHEEMLRRDLKSGFLRVEKIILGEEL